LLRRHTSTRAPPSGGLRLGSYAGFVCHPGTASAAGPARDVHHHPPLRRPCGFGFSAIAVTATAITTTAITVTTATTATTTAGIVGIVEGKGEERSTLLPAPLPVPVEGFLAHVALVADARGTDLSNE
jgi:hypothetical protein